jgi:hypothetical protein
VGPGAEAGAGLVGLLGNMRDRRDGGEGVVLGERTHRVRTTGTWVGELMGRCEIECLVTYEV